MNDNSSNVVQPKLTYITISLYVNRSYDQSYFAKLMNTRIWIKENYTEPKDTSPRTCDIVPCTDTRSAIYYSVRCTAASGTTYNIVSCTDTRRIIYDIVRCSCISHTIIYIVSCTDSIRTIYDIVRCTSTSRTSYD